ncbi:hypothetical protein LEN26_010554 [Aphanomyces euteiches]|nr:hypothetical protein LEN26_010554 [Aphanomyces euteiches]
MQSRVNQSVPQRAGLNGPIYAPNEPSKQVEVTIERQLLLSLRSDRQDVYMCHGDTYEHHIPPFHIAFSEQKMHGSLLAVADEEGYVSYFTTRDRKTNMPPHHQVFDHEKPRARISAHQNAIFDLIWCANDEHIATASGDQHVSVWDVETAAQLYHFEGHSMSVKCVRQMPDMPSVFASGSRDGNIFFWDTRCPCESQTIPHVQSFRPVESCIRCHDFEVASVSGKDKRKKRRTSIPNAQRSVTCVEFTGDGNQLISSGAVDGMVKFWDLRTLSEDVDCLKQVRAFSCLNSSGRRYGISSLALDHTKTKLLVSAASNDIFLYDLMRTMDDPIAKYYGHKNSSFYVKSGFSPDGNFIVSGSVDQNVYIWDVHSSGAPAAVLRGHQGEVSSVAWCKSDFTKIASCSDDGTVRVWHMGGDDKENYKPLSGSEHSNCSRGCGDGHAEVYPESPLPSSGMSEAQYISPASTSRPTAGQSVTLHHFWGSRDSI